MGQIWDRFWTGDRAAALINRGVGSKNRKRVVSNLSFTAKLNIKKPDFERSRVFCFLRVRKLLGHHLLRIDQLRAGAEIRFCWH